MTPFLPLEQLRPERFDAPAILKRLASSSHHSLSKFASSGIA